MQSTLQTYQTVLTVPEEHPNADVNDWSISGKYVDGTNMVIQLNKLHINHFINFGFIL